MRRVLAVLLGLCLLLPMFSAFNQGYAADSYLITVAEDQVLEEVADNQMAVYIDGIIYVPYTTLKSMSNVYVNYNKDQKLVTVYRVGALMRFELDTGLTYDALQQRAISVSAKMRDGVPYLPVSIVTAWMSMYFSFTSAADSGVDYPVIRLCSGTPALSDAKVLARNQSRLKTVADTRDKLSGGVTTEPPTLLPRTTALLFTGLPAQQAGDGTLSQLLTTLESFSLPAAFFLSEEEMQVGGESLREIYARGFSTGILMTDGQDPLAQAQRGAELCAQLLHARVRLVCADGLELSDRQKTDLAEAGFVLWQPAMDPDPAADLSAGKLVSAARRALSRAPEQSSLRLRPAGACAEALPVLCSYLVAQNFTCEPVREWVDPI